MVIGIMGENCAGNSTLADRIKCDFDAEVISGNDYLRMAKSESEASARPAPAGRTDAGEKTRDVR